MDITVFIQPRHRILMKESSLSMISNQGVDGVRIGLCVLGGIYSEGIDLAGDRLGEITWLSWTASGVLKEILLRWCMIETNGAAVL